MTRYQPIHPAGDLGPLFDYATLAILWAIRQPDPRWTIRQVST